jgi:hypothetical protein
MFELYVYLAVSSVPLAFFLLGNGDGTGFSRISMKFLRAFAAVCMQGVMMLICLRAFGIIMTEVIVSGAEDALLDSNASAAVSQLAYTMLLGAIVLVMSVVKCGSWAKAIMDAQ